MNKFTRRTTASSGHCEPRKTRSILLHMLFLAIVAAFNIPAAFAQCPLADPGVITGPTSVNQGATMTVLDATGGGVWSASNGNISINSMGVVTGVSVGTSTVSYGVTNGCGTAYAARVITVSGVGAGVTGQKTVCVGTTTTLVHPTAGGAWSSSNTARATVGSGTGIVTGVSAGTATITYTQGGTDYTANVTVIALASMPAITGTRSVCVNETTALGNSVPGGTWKSTVLANATVDAATGVVSGLVSGTTNITYTLNPGCYAAGVVTIKALPSAIVGGSQICQGTTTTLTNPTSGGGTWSSSNMAAGTIGASSGVVGGIGAGTTTITYRSLSTSCMTSKVVTVNAPLGVGLDAPLSICQGASTTLTVTGFSGGTWASSSALVATVGSATGLATGVAPGNATITYTHTTGCKATGVLTVNALPAAITGLLTVCANSTTALGNTTTPGTWSKTDGSGSISVVAGTGVVTGSSAGTAAVSYTATNTGCVRIATVTVAAALGSITGTTNICSSTTTTLVGPGGGTWSSSDLTKATISSTGVVSGVAAGTATISYIKNAGCRSTTIMTVTAGPAAITGTLSVCPAASTTLSNAVMSGVWSSSNMTVATIGSDDGAVTAGTPGTSSITYTVNGCSRSATFTVKAFPAAITGNAFVCAGGTTTLSSATAGGGTWSGGDVAVGTVATSTGVVTGIDAGTATIIYTAAATTCTLSKVVTVNAALDPIGGTPSVCIGSTTQLTNTDMTGTWSTGNAAVATVGTAGLVTGVSSGVANITYSRGGCRTSQAVTVNVLPGSISGTLAVCSGATTVLGNSTTPGTWSKTDGSGTITVVAGTGAVTGGTTGTATVTYTATNTGCTRSAVVTVNAAVSDLTGTTSVCSSATTTLVGPGGGTWSSSDITKATVTNTGVVTGVAAGTATISYNITAGCRASAIVTVIAGPAAITGTVSVCPAATTTLGNAVMSGVWSSTNMAVATIGSDDGAVTAGTPGTSTISYTLNGCTKTTTFTVKAFPSAITGNAFLCDGGTTTLSSATAGGGTWSSSDPAVGTIAASSGVVTGIDPGTTTITYKATATTCTLSTVVTVNAGLDPIGGTASVCIGSTTQLSNTDMTGTWSSGNVAVATVGTAGLVTGVSSGVANITYSSGGCRTIQAVTVNVLPGSISGLLSVCSGSTTALGNSTTPGTWSKTDGSGSITVVAGTGVVTGGTAGTATITYTATNTGCTRSAVVTVNAAVSSLTGTLSVCNGSTTTLVGPGGGTWSSSDITKATVTNAGVVTGVAAGEATISYNITGGCRATAIVTVVAGPAAITGTVSVCPAATTTLSNAVMSGVWSSSNMSVATIGSDDGQVTATSTPGTTTISYTVNGCTRTTTFTVKAFPAAITGTAFVCDGGTTTLSSATVGGGTWSSSNAAAGTIGSTTGVVTGIDPGTTTVIYTAAATTCTLSTVVTVNAGLDPIGGTASVCIGSTTQLSNTDMTGTWSSGNVAVATVGTAGLVTGVGSGVANITYSSGGCRTIQAVTVNVLPGSISGLLSVCSGSTTALGNSTTPGTWSKTDGSGSIAVVAGTGVVTGGTAGTATVIYTATNTTCTRSAVVTVNAAVSTLTGTLSVCNGSTTTLVGPGGGTWSSSDITKATVTNTGVVTGVAAGTSTISYIVSAGCRASAIVTVIAGPAAITGTVSACPATTTQLSNAVMSGVWSSTNMTVATIGSDDGLVAALTAGTTTISYSLNGCTRTTTVTVKTAPLAIGGTASVCEGGTTTLTNGTGGGGAWFSASTPNATIGASSGIVTGVLAGTATISYTATLTGCVTTKEVTVNAALGATTGTMQACPGTSTTLTPAAPGGTWASSSIAVATVGTGGVVTGVASGTVTITYTLGGCKATSIVTINQLPSGITGLASICSGSTVTLNSTPAGMWSKTDGSGSISVDPSTGIVTGGTAGTSTVTFTATSTGCVRTATVTVISALPGITGTLIACEGGTTQLANGTGGGVWSSSTPATGTIISGNGLFTGVASGTTTVTYTTSGSCRATAVVTVNTPPSVISGASSVCVDATTTLTSSGMGVWSSSNMAKGTVDASTGVVTGIAPGTTVISYSLNSCVRTKVITVNALPSAITGNSGEICNGTSVTLANATSGGGTWSSGNMTVGTVGSSTGTVSALSVGTSSISFTATNTGCIATTVVTVNSGVAAITGTFTACTGSTTQLSSMTGGGAWSSTNMAVGTVGTTGLVAGIAAGTTTISYVAGGCSRSVVVTVNQSAVISGDNALCEHSVYPFTADLPGGTWSVVTAGTSSVGASTGIMTFADASVVSLYYTLANGCETRRDVAGVSNPSVLTGTFSTCAGQMTDLDNDAFGDTYIWSSSNGAVATVDASNGQVTGIAPGTAIITYDITANSCRLTQIVTVNAATTPITGPSSVCSGSTITLSNATTPGVWTKTDGTGSVTIADPAVGDITGGSAGTVTISYTPAGGCAATTTVTVIGAIASIGGTLSSCEGNTTQLTNATVGGVWSSTNGTVATIGTSGLVSALTAGTTTISYTIGSCAVSAEVTVNANTIAAISGATSVCANNSITLTDATGGGMWSSSDMAIGSTSGSSTITGVSGGTVTISYTVSGCYRTYAVTVNAAPGNISGALAVCLGGGTNTLTSATVGGGTWASTNAAVGTIGSSSGVVTSIGSGTTTISYTANSTGCVATAVVTVTTAPSTITGTTTVCAMTTTTLNSTPGGGIWTSSNMTAGTIDASGVVTGLAAGTTVITYAIGTCTKTQIVTVRAAASATTGSQLVCQNLTTTLANPTVGGGAWSSSDVTKGTVGVSSGIVTGIAPGTTTITFTSGISGCKAFTTMTVNATLAAIGTAPYKVCQGQTTMLTNATTGGTWTSSATAVATIGTDGTVTGVANGVTNISYTAGGCRTTASFTVNPLPSVITGTMVMCESSSVTLVNSTTGGTWSSAAGSGSVTASNGTSGVVTGATAGTATVIYTAPTTCTRSAVVTVNAAIPAITGTFNVCVGSTTQLANSNGTGTWLSMAGAIAPVDGTGKVTGSTAGTATISYTVSTGCKSFAIITVNATPGAVTGATFVCKNDVTTFTSTGVTGAWSSSDMAKGTIDAMTGQLTGIAPGTTTISYATTAGCFKTKAVTVRDLPLAINLPASTYACAGWPSTLTNTTPLGGTWSSSDPTVGTIGVNSGVITPLMTGTVTIVYKAVATSCTTSTVLSVVAPVSAGTVVNLTTVNALVQGGSTLDLDIDPASTGGGTIVDTWYSGNDSFATVDNSGIVTSQLYDPLDRDLNIFFVARNGCSVDTSNYYVIHILDMKPGGNHGNTVTGHDAANILQIAPNPTTGSFTLQTSVAGTFTVYTLDGKQVSQYTVAQGANTLNLSTGLAAGVYMCRYNGDDGSKVAVRLVYEP